MVFLTFQGAKIVLFIETEKKFAEKIGLSRFISFFCSRNHSHNYEKTILPNDFLPLCRRRGGAERKARLV